MPKGMVSEYFLRSVVSYNKTRSALQPALKMVPDVQDIGI